MNRAQRILHYVASCQSPASVSQIVDAVAKAETSIPDHAKYSVNVAAQLSEFAKNGKLERSGKYGAYRYTASPIALSDLRKTTRDGKVRNAAKLARAAKPRPLSRPAAAAPPLKAAARTTPQRLALANIGTPAPRKPGERETVEQFLARGGRVQKLAHGASSQPVYADVRAVDQRSMRTRLQKALDTEPANTTDDDAVAA
jgi:hypothetical protein